MVMVSKEKIIKALRLILVDFFGLMIGILNGFFLPVVFNIEGYSLFRTFTLYATYASVFSLGISDGIYLFCGGKDWDSLNHSKIKSYFLLLVKSQVIIFGVLVFLSLVIFKDIAFLYFSFFVFPLQIIHYFRLYYKALGEFDRYSLLQGGLVLLELLNTLLIVFFIKSTQPHIFIIIKIINHMVLALILSIGFLSRNRKVKASNLQQGQALELMRPGFMVLLADLMAAIILSLDRWFIKISFMDKEFAFYSFAVSIMTLFITFITSIMSVLYPYITRKGDDTLFLQLVKKLLLLLSSLSLLAYFGIEFIVLRWIPNYSGSLNVLGLLIMTIPFIAIIHVLYINMYKATKNLKKYLKRMTLVLSVSFFLNLLAVLIFHTMVSIALTTLLTFIFWYFYSAKDFKDLPVGKKELLFLGILMGGFALIQMFDWNSVISFLALLVLILADVFLLINFSDIKLLVKGDFHDGKKKSI